MRSFKSTVAAAAGQVINPAMNVRALQNRVSPETEDVFNDSFWEVGGALHLSSSCLPLLMTRDCAPLPSELRRGWTSSSMLWTTSMHAYMWTGAAYTSKSPCWSRALLERSATRKWSFPT